MSAAHGNGDEQENLNNEAAHESSTMRGGGVYPWRGTGKDSPAGIENILAEGACVGQFTRK